MSTCFNLFALTDSTQSLKANGYLASIFDTYTGANIGADINERVSLDFYPLRDTFINEFKFSQKKIKNCNFDYHINKISELHLEFHIDINWQKKNRKIKKSIVETTKGHTVFIFDKTGKLLKIKGDNPFK